WEPKYKRNRVRHDLIPTLQIKYSLAIKEHLYNLSQIAQEEDAWLSQETSDILTRIASTNAPNQEIAFNVSEFANLTRGTQRRVLREALLTVAGTERDFTFKQVEAAIAILSNSESTQRAMHLPHGLIVERLSTYGYVKQRHQPAPELGVETNRPLVEQKWQSEFEPESNISTTTGWRLETGIISEAGISPEELKTDALSAIFDLEQLQEFGPLEWRTRQPGDRMHPFGMSGSKTLQDIMLDAKIPRGQREHIPLMAAKNRPEIIWIPGKGGRRSIHAPLSPQTTSMVIIKWTNTHHDGESIA
ncbi:MAG: tRNA lysidine(34) synthetase TilS, partial [Chloroflexia bacterium]